MRTLPFFIVDHSQCTEGSVVRLKDSLHVLPALRWLEVVADTGGETFLEPSVALIRIGAKKPLPELANGAYKLTSLAVRTFLLKKKNFLLSRIAFFVCIVIAKCNLCAEI